MKRAFATLASAALLVALIPASVGAAKPTKYTDHNIEAFCNGAFDGGSASAGLFTSTQFGDSAGAEVWLDPAVPFEEPPAMSGSTETVDQHGGSDRDRARGDLPGLRTRRASNSATQSSIATLQPVGDPEVIEPTLGKSNHHTRTNGTRQPIEGTANLSMPGLAPILADCSGFVTDVDVFGRTRTRS